MWLSYALVLLSTSLARTGSFYFLDLGAELPRYVKLSTCGEVVGRRTEAVSGDHRMNGKPPSMFQVSGRCR